MRIFRIAKNDYLSDLSGEGARLYGGRWNKKGYNMLYCSQFLSLCVLELLVHMDFKFINQDFGFIELEVPDELIATKSSNTILRQDWRHNPPLVATQDFGSSWLLSRSDLAIRMPSAVLPHENNILINPNHERFADIKVIRKGLLDLDARVLGT
ncbi:RES domain-containing protein [Gelidibacter algens]|uniref:RES domain-containing protein n=1 Tax=Gelidibacter algens TaxID=49280 RepID=A0A1A7QUT0_9FLAO|nr:RES family NAD+ phosphorylase [Gelidibacter algens]OBX23286.1 hypothetical protein A9996_16055 [Gelidibacter algens]RAJ18661.1 RES domain-containing protein [Gelidibacter algens]